MTATFRELYGLFKIRISLAIALSALAGLAVTPGLSVSSVEIAVLLLTALGSSAAAGAFNQLAERDLDTLMKRTCNRPFASGTAIMRERRGTPASCCYWPARSPLLVWC